MNWNRAIILAEFVVIIVLGFLSFSFYSRATPIGNTQILSFNEPPSLTAQPNDRVSIVNDLETIGCKVFPAHDAWVLDHQLMSYADFRRFAYNSGVVFISPKGYVWLYTIYNGIIFSYGFSFQE